MLLLPVANPLGILVIPEVILVLRFGQPGSLRLALASSTASSLLAIALALSVSIIGKKKFLAVEAFASGLRRLHRFQNQEEPIAETARTRRKKIHRQENSNRRRRKKRFQRMLRRKDQRRRSTFRPAILIQFYFAAGKVASPRESYESKLALLKLAYVLSPPLSPIGSRLIHLPVLAL